MLKRIAKIESYGFECIAGPLELCVDWIELKDNVKNILAENERLSALAAQHLADQELLVGRERKRVARECAEIIEQHLKSIGKVKDPYDLGAKMACVTIRDVIRTRYGVEE